MVLTLGQWVVYSIWFVLTLLATTVIVAGGDYEGLNWIGGILNFAFSCLVMIIVMFANSWYNTNTASGQRNYKDYTSNIQNGIEREIIITSEDGRQIFHYEGKVDIESNHTDNYIKFESEEGKRYIIYYGIQDTILIKEK